VLGYVLGAWESLGRRRWLGLAAFTLLVIEPGPRVIGSMVVEVAATATLVFVSRPERSDRHRTCNPFAHLSDTGAPT
jgi:hypothetical protein